MRRPKSRMDIQGKLAAYTTAIKARKSVVSANAVAHNDLMIAGGPSKNPGILPEIQAAKHQNCHAQKPTSDDHPPRLLPVACGFSKYVSTDSETLYTALRTSQAILCWYVPAEFPYSSHQQLSVACMKCCRQLTAGTPCVQAWQSPPVSRPRSQGNARRSYRSGKKG